MATIKDVAQASGVTPMTVWSVLSNRPGRVGPETRERVLRAVRETGYKPRAVKRATDRGHMNTLGVLSRGGYFGLAEPGYMSQMLNGIITAAGPARQHLTLFETTPFYEDAARSVRTYCDGRCDGLLIMPPFSSHEIVPALTERGFPFVVIGETIPGSQMPSVDVNNVAAAVTAVGFLIETGHRRIAFLRDSAVNSALQREEGYRHVLNAHGISVAESLVRHCEWSETGVAEMTVDLLRMPDSERPTALFCWNDMTAIAAISALERLGLHVPDDISVVGFDDGPFASDTHPSLTTIRQPYLEIGKRAVEMLLAQIDQQPASPCQILLPGQLIVRDSVAPPR